MIARRHIPRWRLLIAVVLAVLSLLQQQWLLLLPAAALLYLWYRARVCVVCEAGFCDPPQSAADDKCQGEC